jgi:hypothetical protein
MKQMNLDAADFSAGSASKRTLSRLMIAVSATIIALQAKQQSIVSQSIFQ